MADYTYYAKITVQNSKVAETDAGFAVPINGTYDGTGGEPDLRTVGNGGHIQNTDATGGASGAYTVPADLTFRTTADLTVAGASLDFEIEKYDAATGEIVAWVQSGVIVDTDVDIYMVYGNADVTTSQENVAGTWDADFKAVWHLAEASATTNVEDSKATYDGTKKAASEPIQSAGKIGYGQDFDGNDYVWLVADAFTGSDFASGLTFEAWVNVDTLGGSNQNIIDLEGRVVLNIALTSDLINMGIYDGAWQYAISNAAISTGTWYHLVGTWNATTILLYIDGVLQTITDTATGTTLDAVSRTSGIGAYATGPSSFVYGLIDEARISNTARSADYVTTAYNSQSSPSTFYSMGAEQSLSFTADAVLKGTQVGSFTADAYLQTLSITADAVLKETQSDSFTADAYLSEIFTADAVLKETQSSSFTADSVLKETQFSSFTADGILLETTTDTFTADAVLLETQTGSFTADACLTSDAVSSRQYLFTKAGPVNIPVFPFQPISVSVTTNHTADYREIIFCNATSGSLTVTLPEAADNLDKVYTIKHTSGSHSVYVASADTIDGETTQPLIQYNALKVVSDSSAWWII